MDQNENERNEEQEQMRGSSFDVHLDRTNGPTILGDNSTVVQDQRRIVNVVVNLSPGTSAYF